MSPEKPIPHDPDILPVKIVWPIDHDAPVMFCNQFMVGNVGLDVVLDCGHTFIMGPGGRSKEEFSALIGTPEVKVTARIIMNPGTLYALIDALKQQMAKLPVKIEKPDGKPD